MDKNCNNCKFAIFQDFGYSNWTVEGTSFSCAKKVHPDGDFDRFYGENPKLDYGQSCLNHEEGEPIDMDVDHEGVEELTPEKLVIWNMDQQ